MKALVKRKAQKGIWMEDNIHMPILREQDVLIKIKKTAICGTDIHIYNWDEWAQKTIPIPMHVGHEYTGVIEKIGSAVKGLTVGQRVSGEGHIVCGHCRSCRAGERHLCAHTIGVGVNRPGCFAEYLSLPAENVFPLPYDITDEEASILDPLGNAAHTALSFDLVGEDVLVTGAGPIGIMGAKIAQHVGARHVVITDINEYRLELARKLGIKNVVNAQEEPLSKVMKQLHMTEGFDVGLEMSGSSQAFSSMVHNMRHGGKMALLGILPPEAKIPWNDVIFKGLLLKGIYGRQMYETWYKMVALLQSGLDIDPIITHRFHVDEYEKAFEIMASGKSGKVILNWE